MERQVQVNGHGQLFVASAVPASNPHHQAHGLCFGSARSTKRIRPARLPHHYLDIQVLQRVLIWPNSSLFVSEPHRFRDLST